MLRELKRKPSRRKRRHGGTSSTTAPASARSQGYQKAVTAKLREDDRSSEIHGLLNARLGDQLYNQWFVNAAILIDENALTIVTASRFQSSWIEENFAAILLKATAKATGLIVQNPRFMIEGDAPPKRDKPLAGIARPAPLDFDELPV